MRNIAYVHINYCVEVRQLTTSEMSLAIGIRTSDNALGGLAAQSLHVWLSLHCQSHERIL